MSARTLGGRSRNEETHEEQLLLKIERHPGWRPVQAVQSKAISQKAGVGEERWLPTTSSIMGTLSGATVPALPGMCWLGRGWFLYGISGARLWVVLVIYCITLYVSPPPAASGQKRLYNSEL
jgi:hypothetical protein